jgi:hypothetical protein
VLRPPPAALTSTSEHLPLLRYFCTRDFSKTHCYAKCSPSSVGNEVSGCR